MLRLSLLFFCCSFSSQAVFHRFIGVFATPRKDSLATGRNGPAKNRPGGESRMERGRISGPRKSRRRLRSVLQLRERTPLLIITLSLILSQFDELFYRCPQFHVLFPCLAISAVSRFACLFLPALCFVFLARGPVVSLSASRLPQGKTTASVKKQAGRTERRGKK